ncbi:short-chain dehydrogenase [Pleomassaria siparia CBS 279.74]|uniref:Short-chain dehydrogenase n=1 Tax=Pleomassaria siparia CBS 279.74 TaxID=1314801 RepID=A0A6G1JXB8_9PLEO|nr:short-chain dehydrogenase [Pleomassaria siparia CBS 279.74]
MATMDPPPPPPVPRPLRVQEQDLRGKVALVTGATKGIGRAIVLELATRGASILGTSTTSPFSPVSDEIFDLHMSLNSTAVPTLVGIHADITSLSAPATILDALRTDFDGKVDILVFNAAVMGLAKTGEGTMNPEWVDRCLAGNVRFPVLLMEGLVAGEYLRRESRVIAISSEGVRARRPDGGAVYAASKAALECLMRKWADELGTHPTTYGTTFNSISVGFTKTESYRRIPMEMRDWLTASDAAEVAVGNRIGEVQDVADVVGLLAGEKSRWISGSVVDASGGKAKIM